MCSQGSSGAFFGAVFVRAAKIRDLRAKVRGIMRTSKMPDIRTATDEEWRAWIDSGKLKRRQERAEEFAKKQALRQEQQAAFITAKALRKCKKQPKAREVGELVGVIRTYRFSPTSTYYSYLTPNTSRTVR